MSSSPEKLDRLKHVLVLKLEHQKWQYRKRELVGLEAGQHLRALNSIMWQVPGMAIAITGGLWFGVTTINNDPPKVCILIFAAMVDLITVPVIFRLRGVIEKQILVQRELADGTVATKKERDRIVVLCWSFLLVGAAMLNIIGACNVSELDKKIVAVQSNSENQMEVITNIVNKTSCPAISSAPNTKLPLYKQRCP